MIVSRIILKNWKNFREVDVNLGSRVFLVGPNASGKSNFLDVFRFLSDIAKPGGGLQKAVSDRGGLSKIRCLAARQYPNVEIEIHFAELNAQKTTWKYAIGIKQMARGYRLPSKNHNLIFRVAVKEVEAWLLAHGKAIATFLGIKNDLIPKDVESVDNPKQLLINLARSSNKRVLKESIVPKSNSTAKVGPDYNGCLISFVNEYWKVNEAIVNSPSLNKTMVALEEFRPKFG